jgi:hypothetical protein
MSDQNEQPKANDIKNKTLGRICREASSKRYRELNPEDEGYLDKSAREGAWEAAAEAVRDRVLMDSCAIPEENHRSIIQRLDLSNDAVFRWLRENGEVAVASVGAPSFVSDMYFTASERIADLKGLLAVAVERDDADRRAGAAERNLEYHKKAYVARNEWLAKAKRDAGYSENESFDVVWEAALQALLSERARIEKRL